MTRGTIAAGLAVCAAAVAPAGAAEWLLDPVVNLTVSRHSNVNFIPTFAGLESNLNSNGDTIGMLGARLALTATTPRSRFVLGVEPTIERYSTNTNLDNQGYHADIAWNFNPSTLTHWYANAGWTLWDRPRYSYEAVTTPVLTPRNRTTTVNSTMGADTTLSPRNQVNFGLSYSSTDYGQQVVVAGTIPLASSRTYDIFAGFQHALTPLRSWRLDYRGSRIDEGPYGTREVHRVLLGYLWGIVERQQLRISLGVAEPRVLDPGVRADTSANAEIIGSATYTYKVARRSDLTVSAGRDYTGSGGTVGAAITESITGAWRQSVGTYSTVSAYASYGRYNPVDETPITFTGRLPDGSIGPVTYTPQRTSTAAVHGEWAAALSPQWYIVTSLELVRQETASTSQYNVDYGILGLGIRWAPTAMRQRVEPPVQVPVR